MLISNNIIIVTYNCYLVLTAYLLDYAFIQYVEKSFIIAMDWDIDSRYGK